MKEFEKSPSAPTSRPGVVITGAAGDLGAALARGFVDHGWNVALLDIDLDRLRSIAEPIGASIASADVTSSADIDHTIAEIAQEWGGIDCLVNSAGITRPSPSSELSDADWRLVVDVNLTGAFLASRAAYPSLCARGGSIVNITSIAATRAMPGRSAYTASKAGLAGLTASLAVEWAPHGIRVNAVAPAWIDSAFVRSLAAQGIVNIDELIDRIPLGRLCTNQDVVAAVLFLADSNAPGFITGQTLNVDGGYLPAG